MHTGRSRAGHLAGTPVSCSTARAASPRLPLVPHGAGRRSWVPPRRLRADWQLGSSCRKSTGAAPCGSSANRESPARETRALRVGGRGTRAASPRSARGAREGSAAAPLPHRASIPPPPAAVLPPPRLSRALTAAVPLPSRPRGGPQPAHGCGGSRSPAPVLPFPGGGCREWGEAAPGPPSPGPRPPGAPAANRIAFGAAEPFCSS